MTERSYKALVLGPEPAASLIRQELELQGFAIQQSIRTLPSPGQPDSIRILREILTNAQKAAEKENLSLWVHPGVSVWAERPELPQIGQDLGIPVISPPTRVISLFSNRLNLLAEADRLGISTLVTSFDPIQSIREIETMVAEGQATFPFVLKSVWRGETPVFRLVHGPGSGWEKEVGLWLEQLRYEFGEALLYAERAVSEARRILVPFTRFKDGRIYFFPKLDSSLQIRDRKIMEICPPTGIDLAVMRRLENWTELLTKSQSYVGVGVLDFLVDGNRAYLVDALPRLNRGFHLWEKIAGTRAVEWQLAAMQTIRTPENELPASKPQPEWNAGISLRLYAEDPVLQLPQPGRVHELSPKRTWQFPGSVAELNLTVTTGDDISPLSDGTVGWLRVGGQDIKSAITLARGILEELWIAGSLQTNERFLSELLSHPWVKEGMFHAGFVDEEFIPEVSPPVEQLPLFAALCTDLQPDVARWSVGDQWIKPKTDLIRWTEGPKRWTTKDGPGISGKIRLPDERVVNVCAYPVAHLRWNVRIGLWTLSVRGVRPGAGSQKSRRPSTHPLYSLTRGRVHSVLYREGATVPAHHSVVLVESLRTLIPHALPVDVRVVRWKVRAEQMVEHGEELAEVVAEQLI